MTWTQKTCDYSQGRLRICRLPRRDQTCKNELSLWFTGAGTNTFILNKLDKQSKSWCSMSQLSSFGSQHHMDPVVATYIVCSRWYGKLMSEKLSFIAQHILSDIQGLHPQPGRTYTNRKHQDTLRPIPDS